MILSIDQGTTNTKAIGVDQSGKVVGSGAAPVGLASPHPGWIEQDAAEIWASVLAAVAACRAPDQPDSTLAGVTISNQRESVVAWRRSTGDPLGPVIGWQDRRTASWCTELATKDADDASGRAPAYGSTPCSPRRSCAGCSTSCRRFRDRTCA